jgi:hypothetical protein
MKPKSKVPSLDYVTRTLLLRIVALPHTGTGNTPNSSSIYPVHQPSENQPGPALLRLKWVLVNLRLIPR